jgi:hypothetical protein
MLKNPPATGGHTDLWPTSFNPHGCLGVIFTSVAQSGIRTLMVFPFPAFGSQLSQQTFGRREQFAKTSVRLHSEVFPIEDGDLKTDLGPILTFGGVHDAMHRRIRISAGLEQI